MDNFSLFGVFDAFQAYSTQTDATTLIKSQIRYCSTIFREINPKTLTDISREISCATRFYSLITGHSTATFSQSFCMLAFSIVFLVKSLYLSFGLCTLPSSNLLLKDSIVLHPHRMTTPLQPALKYQRFYTSRLHSRISTPLTYSYHRIHNIRQTNCW